ncbi:MAG: insulinase family protein, partial [Bacteroidota bacterium]|nr:insulinase family protein [Bacteroidota bacterium]
LVFSEISVLNKAMNLGYYELLGNAQLANLEIEKYRKVTSGQMQTIAQELFDDQNRSTLFYLSKNQN